MAEILGQLGLAFMAGLGAGMAAAFVRKMRNIV